TENHFASGAYAALKKGVAEAGWDATDCGTDDPAAAVEEDEDCDAILTRVPVPEESADIASMGGSDGAPALSGSQNDELDDLIAELARTPDYYVARDLRVQIEATLVEDAVALPLASQPVLTISDRAVVGVQPPPGTPITFGTSDWGPPEEKLN